MLAMLTAPPSGISRVTLVFLDLFARAIGRTGLADPSSARRWVFECRSFHLSERLTYPVGGLGAGGH